MMLNKRQRGLGIAEIIIALFIVGIVSSTLVYYGISYRKELANLSKTVAELRSIADRAYVEKLYGNSTQTFITIKRDRLRISAIPNCVFVCIRKQLENNQFHNSYTALIQANSWSFLFIYLFIYSFSVIKGKSNCTFNGQIHVIL